MNKNTFKYYIGENGEPKVEMSQNVASYVKMYRDGFEEAMRISTFDKPTQKMFTAQSVAAKFLEDDSVYENIKSENFMLLSNDDSGSVSGIILGYEKFLDDVKAKIDELLGIKEK